MEMETEPDTLMEMKTQTDRDKDTDRDTNKYRHKIDRNTYKCRQKYIEVQTDKDTNR